MLHCYFYVFFQKKTLFEENVKFHLVTKTNYHTSEVQRVGKMRKEIFYCICIFHSDLGRA